MRPSNAAILALLDAGMTQQAAADHLGVTKNIIAGVWARAGLGSPHVEAKTTMAERLDALHAQMDAVLAETMGVGRLPNEPPKKHARPTLPG
jgi:hypothetical protein